MLLTTEDGRRELGVVSVVGLSSSSSKYRRTTGATSPPPPLLSIQAFADSIRRSTGHPLPWPLGLQARINSTTNKHNNDIGWPRIAIVAGEGVYARLRGSSGWKKRCLALRVFPNEVEGGDSREGLRCDETVGFCGDTRPEVIIFYLLLRFALFRACRSIYLA
jgi:hypothetical protein